MSIVNDGGPAYPAEEAQWSPEGLRTYTTGMTLRDYFAAKAMHASLMNVEPTKNDTHKTIAEGVAIVAYIIADAMLRAREN